MMVGQSAEDVSNAIIGAALESASPKRKSRLLWAMNSRRIMETFITYNMKLSCTP